MYKNMQTFPWCLVLTHRQKSCIAYCCSLVINTLEFGNRLTLTSHHPLIKVPLAFRRSVGRVTTWTNHSQGVQLQHCLQFPASAVLPSHPVLDGLDLLLHATIRLDSEYKVNMEILISLLSKTSGGLIFFLLYM